VSAAQLCWTSVIPHLIVGLLQGSDPYPAPHAVQDISRSTPPCLLLRTCCPLEFTSAPSHGRVGTRPVRGTWEQPRNTSIRWMYGAAVAACSVPDIQDRILHKSCLPNTKGAAMFAMFRLLRRAGGFERRYPNRDRTPVGVSASASAHSPSNNLRHGELLNGSAFFFSQRDSRWSSDASHASKW